MPALAEPVSLLLPGAVLLAGQVATLALSRLAAWLPARIDPRLVSGAAEMGWLARSLLHLVALGLTWAALARLASPWLALAVTLWAIVLLMLAWIDLRTGLLPDLLTLPLLWAGLLVNLHGALVPLPQAVLGAAAGYLLLWCVYHGFLLATGREGLGRGDFKLLAALGAWLGWTGLPDILLLSAAAGLFGALGARLLYRRPVAAALPYGPCLAWAGMIVMLRHLA